MYPKTSVDSRTFNTHHYANIYTCPIWTYMENNGKGKQWLVTILIIYMEKFLNSDWRQKMKYSGKKEIQCKFLNFLNFYFSKFLKNKNVTYARDCIIFSCILLVSNSIVLVQFQKRYTRFQRLQIALVFRTRAILIVFEKLTRAYFFQIALETILLHIQTTYYYIYKQHTTTYTNNILLHIQTTYTNNILLHIQTTYYYIYKQHTISNSISELCKQYTNSGYIFIDSLRFPM
jgi:hypothetical protein